MAAKPTETPGLIYAKRKSGPPMPLWRAPKAAILAGFPIKTWNLSECPPEELPARCQRIWAEAIAFAGKQPAQAYNGTVRSLMELYQLHKESPYRRLKPATIKPYDFYISKITAAYGNRRVANITGLDVMRWNEDWRGAEQHLAAAAMATAVLKAALGFGQLCGYADCKHLREVLSVLRLPHQKAREQAPAAFEVSSLGSPRRPSATPFSSRPRHTSTTSLANGFRSMTRRFRPSLGMLRMAPKNGWARHGQRSART